VSVWEQVDIKVSRCFGSQFKCHRSHPNCWACPPNPFKDVALATKISEATWFGYLDQELAQKKKKTKGGKKKKNVWERWIDSEQT